MKQFNTHLFLTMLLSISAGLHADIVVPTEQALELAQTEAELNKPNLPRGFGVKFSRGMRANTTYSREFLKKHADWNVIKFLYDHYLTSFTQSESYRIPTIIHQLFLEEPTEKQKQLQETWQKLHPHWHYKAWTTKDIEELCLENKATYATAQTLEQKRSIARAEILYRFGGVCIDADVECVKAFDIFHQTCDFYAGLSFDHHAMLNDAVVGATPRHPILRAYMIAIRVSKDDPSFTDTKTGNATLTHAFKSEALVAAGHNIVFPLSYFCPRTHDADVNKKTYKLSSFAVKHWESSTKDTAAADTTTKQIRTKKLYTK